MQDYSELIARLEAAYKVFNNTMTELELRAGELIKTETQKINRAQIEEVLEKIKNISGK